MGVGAWPNSLPDLGMSCESGPSDTLHTTHAVVGEAGESAVATAAKQTGGGRGRGRAERRSWGWRG